MERHHEKMLLRSALILIGLVAATLSACSTPDETAPKSCVKTLDCPSGQACRNQVCTVLPCGGRCNRDEVCLSDVCTLADGLDCSLDARICPTDGFVCSGVGKCARSCTSDAECTQPGFQTCNVDAGFCGECTFDRDCTDPDRRVCDGRTAKCVGCNTSRDCLAADRQPNGRYCDAADKACKQGCLSDAECGPNTRCKRDAGEDVGRCIECEPTSANPDQGCIDEARPRCEPQSLLCVECMGDTDCSTAQCLTSRHVCVECVRNEVCLKGNICNPATNICIAGCAGGTGDANCPAATPVCDPVRGNGNGACVECLRDADCPRAKVCDTTNAVCITGCHGDSSRCIDTTGAVPPPVDQVCETSIDRCVQCRDQADCPSDKSCDPATFACRFKKTGEPCTTNAECGYNPADSNPANRSTLGAACISSITCDSPKSSPGLGSPICSQSAAALPGRGEQGACPSGYVADKTNAVNATGISSVYGVRCVPSAKQCR